MMGTRPVPFKGTEDERRANYLSHNFVFSGDPEDAEVRCTDCDSRPSYVAADYPCGVNVPREAFG